MENEKMTKVVGQLRYDSSYTLGKGGFSIVYRGFDCQSNKPVAVKQIQIGRVKEDDAQKEVNLMKVAHKHSSILKYICFEKDTNFLYIATELCRGTLEDYVNKNKYVGPEFESEQEILYQVTKGLAHLHKLDIVHRDIKPTNILIFAPEGGGAKPQVKLADFGISKALSSSEEDYTNTSVTNPKGTRGWMAPEVYKFKRFDSKVDIFPLGLIFAYTLSKGNKHPFGDDADLRIARIKQMESMTLTQQDLKEPYSRDSTAFELIESMLAIDFDKRPTAEDVINSDFFTSGLNTIHLRGEKTISSNRKISILNEPIMGIDLGTTYSRVGVFMHDKVEIITNEYGDIETPSCVAFTENERFIGKAAINMMLKNYSENDFVFDAKRLIGRRFDDPFVHEGLKKWPFKVINDKGKPKIEVNYKGPKLFTPEEISSMVLFKMKLMAEVYLGNPVTKAVIAIPTYFNHAQRQATKNAGKISGLDVIHIINESTAAALAYGYLYESEVERTILIFDFAGSNTNVSILRKKNGGFTVISTSGSYNLGGHDLTTRMVNHYVQEIKRKYNKDLSNDVCALNKLHFACDEAKEHLSSSLQASIGVRALFDRINFVSSITRGSFEEINKDLFQLAIDLVEKAIQGAKMNKFDIQDIVLVGGSTRIPKVQLMLKDYFDGRRNIVAGINPGEVVARGATIQAAILLSTKS